MEEVGGNSFNIGYKLQPIDNLPVSVYKKADNVKRCAVITLYISHF